MHASAFALRTKCAQRRDLALVDSAVALPETPALRHTVFAEVLGAWLQADVITGLVGLSHALSEPWGDGGYGVAEVRMLLDPRPLNTGNARHVFSRG